MFIECVLMYKTRKKGFQEIPDILQISQDYGLPNSPSGCNLFLMIRNIEYRRDSFIFKQPLWYLCIAHMIKEPALGRNKMFKKLLISFIYQHINLHNTDFHYLFLFTALQTTFHPMITLIFAWQYVKVTKINWNCQNMTFYQTITYFYDIMTIWRLPLVSINKEWLKLILQQIIVQILLKHISFSTR